MDYLIGYAFYQNSMETQEISKVILFFRLIHSNINIIILMCITITTNLPGEILCTKINSEINIRST